MLRGRRAFCLLLVATAAFCAHATAAHAISVPWCGTGEPSTDAPDTVSAYEWHIIYALPDGGVDRFAQFAPRFAGDAATVSSWWAGQDPTRRPRWDLIDAPGCASDYGRVDISIIHVPASVTTFAGIRDAAIAAGFNNPDKGYLVYFDGSPHVDNEYGVCGEGAVDDVTFAYSIVYLQTCGQVSSDDTRAMITAHEMTHGMGAVPAEAPHYCNGGHVCDASNDLMKAVFDPGDTLAGMTLDVGHDDYYGHTGTWWNVKDSGLLYDLDKSLDPAPEIVNLTATNSGSNVRVDWAPSTTARNDVYYRIYDAGGNLINDDKETTTIVDQGTLGDTLTWTIRAATGTGFLSHPATIRFKVGYGIVDAAGNLLKDTVPPGAVHGLRAVTSGSKTELHWSAVPDPLGVRGYRVSAPGLRSLVVPGTSLGLPHAKLRGKTVRVAAVDGGGNSGEAAAVRVR